MLNIYPLLRGGDVHASSGRAPIELNPVLVILSLLFWDAIWGIPGALLAVPLLAIIRYSPTVSTRSRASEISLARDETPSAFRSNSIFFGDGLEVILGESHVFGGV